MPYYVPLMTTCYSTLHHSATQCNTLQRIATHCTAMQHTAAYCNTLQHIAPHDKKPMCMTRVTRCRMQTNNTLQHTATHYNTLQHAATRCNTLQHAALHCNTLHYTAAHCNTLHARCRCGNVTVSFLHNAISMRVTSLIRAGEMSQLYSLHVARHFLRMLQHAATRCNTRKHAAIH